MLCVSGVMEASEEAMTALSKSRPDQRPLDKLSMLSDWTTVDTTDHTDTDQLSDHDDDLRTDQGPLQCTGSDHCLISLIARLIVLIIAIIIAIHVHKDSITTKQ